MKKAHKKKKNKKAARPATVQASQMLATVNAPPAKVKSALSMRPSAD